MARNPYAVLGLAPTASDADIRAAFRKLAKQYHPDRNPDDKKAEEKFKEVSAAFDVIGDADRRKKFDRGEIDEEGRERAHPYGQWGGGAGSAGGYARGRPGGGFDTGGPGSGASFEDLSDIFSDLFGARGGRNGGARPARGRDMRYRLEVDFLDAVRGAKKRVTMPDGRTLDLAIPAGLEDGQSLRLKGQGEKGPGGAGDVYVDVRIRPDKVFERRGDDIHAEVSISLKEAVLGGKIKAPTIDGDVTLTVPKYSNSGTVLRLRGRGVARGKSPAGDQYVRLKIVLPEGGDKELEEFVKHWKGAEARSADDLAGV
ncbi:MAG: DnaJ C-terminal domain-containing protein [Pseudomonadota bacterium]